MYCVKINHTFMNNLLENLVISLVIIIVTALSVLLLCFICLLILRRCVTQYSQPIEKTVRFGTIKFLSYESCITEDNVV